MMVGCSNPDEEMKARLDHQQARIADIERDLLNSRQAQLEKRATGAAAPDPAAADLEKTVARSAQTLARLEDRLAALEARMGALEKPRPAPVEAPEPPPGKILPSKPPEISIYSAPDHRLADFIETAGADSPDLFPVQVSDVSGRKIVVGSHKTTRIVENSETDRDEYGRKNPERKEVLEDVHEYAYEVTFSVKNLTRTEKTLSFAAGGGTRSLLLEPGEVATGVAVRSALGADLHVEASGMVRSFPVTY
jgi:uncharacterized coiled-coil protein SlyX